MATVNGFMPGEWDWMDGGKPGAAPMMEGLLGNPALQMGLGILANNQGNYGQFGPAIGRGLSQGLQQVQASKQFDMQNKMYKLRMEEMERHSQQQQQREEALPRLLDPENSYTRTTEVPVTSFENVPMAPQEGAVAPNFNLQRQETTAMQPQTSFDQNRYMQDIIAAGYGDKLVEKNLFPAAPELMFAPDGTAINKNDPSLIGRKFDKPESVPSAIQEYQFAQEQGFPGTFQEFQIEQKKAGASRTSVNVNQTQEKEENKAVGKYFGEQYSDIQKAGLSAGGKINRVERMNQLLEGVNTGKLAPLGVEIASTAQSLGFNIDPKLGNKQAAEALANEMALEMRNPSGGAGMPGAMSDKDREFLKQIVPGIEKTPQGRKLITESMIKLANRDREVAKMARQYRKKNGTLDEGFFEQLQGYSDSNPLFNGAPVAGKRAINALRMNPSLRDEFDAKYGSGAAARVLGR